MTGGHVDWAAYEAELDASAARIHATAAPWVAPLLLVIFASSGALVLAVLWQLWGLLAVLP